MLEKRKTPRIAIEDVTVEINKPTEFQNPLDMCGIVNLSPEGLLFESSSDFLIGQSLTLTFVLPQTFVIIRTEAEIIHQYTENHKQYIGVKFIGIEPSDTAAIRSFFERSSRK